MRTRIYEIIELSTGQDLPSKIYDVIMLGSIICSLFPMMFRRNMVIFTVMEWSATIVFILDYLLRLWTADLKLPRFKKLAFLVYPFTPMAIVDLLSILPTVLLLNARFHLFVMFRLLRMVKIFRVFKLARYTRGFLLLKKVFMDQRDALIALFSLAFSYIILSALIMFNVEPAAFPTFFSAIYWSTITLTSVGYGDIYPVTTAGQLVAMISSMIGLAIVALPTGIITAGFMKEVLHEDKEILKSSDLDKLADQRKSALDAPEHLDPETPPTEDIHSR
ncbi:MAG: ion transporter [Butyricicoccus sp.]